MESSLGNCTKMQENDFLRCETNLHNMQISFTYMQCKQTITNVTFDTKCAFSDTFLIIRSESFQIDAQLHWMRFNSKSIELNRKSGYFWLIYWILLVAQIIFCNVMWKVIVRFELDLPAYKSWKIRPGNFTRNSLFPWGFHEVKCWSSCQLKT